MVAHGSAVHGDSGSEGQASSRVSGEKFSPCEAEPEFGAVGILSCPSCVGGQEMYMAERQGVPQGLGQQTSAAHGQNGHAEHGNLVFRNTFLPPATFSDPYSCQDSC